MHRLRRDRDGEEFEPVSVGNESPRNPTHDGAQAPGAREQIALPADSLERFVGCFERSAKRWELIVYPALFAFVILAGYGFFLVYSLTHDMRTVAHSMETMVATMDEMSHKLDSLEPMLMSMSDMDQSIRAITATNDAMRQQMAIMTHSVARPLTFMSQFMPW
jgi:hypothetical protein